MSELLSGINPGASEVSRQVYELYRFLFDRVTVAYRDDKVDRLGEILPVLNTERETWLQVCELLPETPLPPQVQSPVEEVPVGDPISNPITFRHGRPSVLNLPRMADGHEGLSAEV